VRQAWERLAEREDLVKDAFEHANLVVFGLRAGKGL